MKRKFFFILLLIVSIFAIKSQSGAYKNQFTKVLLHKGNLSDKLVCFFSKEPICNQVPRSNVQKKEVLSKKRFFLPLTSAQTTQVKSMISSASIAKKDGYSIAFESVDKPMKGTVVEIGYDPEKIGFEYEHFESIGARQGIMFKFHRKDILTTIKEKTDSIMQFASLDKVPHIALDFGHGGVDAGAIGFFQLKEKEVAQAIGDKVACLLKKKAIMLI